MKYSLFVSYNCGCHYEKEGESSNLKKLIKRARELDKEMLRWSIEDEKGNFVDISKIHKDILCTMEKINQSKEA